MATTSVAASSPLSRLLADPIIVKAKKNAKMAIGSFHAKVTSQRVEIVTKPVFPCNCVESALSQQLPNSKIIARFEFVGKRVLAPGILRWCPTNFSYSSSNGIHPFLSAWTLLERPWRNRHGHTPTRWFVIVVTFEFALRLQFPYGRRFSTKDEPFCGTFLGTDWICRYHDGLSYHTTDFVAMIEFSLIYSRDAKLLVFFRGLDLSSHHENNFFSDNPIGKRAQKTEPTTTHLSEVKSFVPWKTIFKFLQSQRWHRC